MELHVDDDAFVRAPVGLVYRRLTDIGGWSDWWPGVRTTPSRPADGAETWSLVLARRPWRRLRVEAAPHQWRHDAGFRCTLTGDLDGWSEFWLEELGGGTVVHHLLVAATGRRRPRRVLEDYRAVVRRGLWAFKDRTQTEVRAEAGLTP